MKKYALLGKGVSHSFSATIHNYIFRTTKYNANYELIEIVDEKHLVKQLQLLREGLYHGYNITAPYKEVVMNYLDEISKHATAIGAVNHVYLKGDLLCGDNTDYYGLLQTFVSNKIDVREKNVYILGSGGTAKTAVAVLTNLGVTPVIVSRTKERVKWYPKVISYDELDWDGVDIYVNTTPVGMYPNVEDTPLSKIQVNNKIIVDVIYNPKITKLMSYTTSLSVNGVEMLFTQAYKSQEIWQARVISCDKHDFNNLLKEINYE